VGERFKGDRVIQFLPLAAHCMIEACHDSGRNNGFPQTGWYVSAERLDDRVAVTAMKLPALVPPLLGLIGAAAVLLGGYCYELIIRLLFRSSS
jgi:hypothetical protein